MTIYVLKKQIGNPHFLLKSTSSLEYQQFPVTCEDQVQWPALAAAAKVTSVNAAAVAILTSAKVKLHKAIWMLLS